MPSTADYAQSRDAVDTASRILHPRKPFHLVIAAVLLMVVLIVLEECVERVLPTHLDAVPITVPEADASAETPSRQRLLSQTSKS